MDYFEENIEEPMPEEIPEEISEPKKIDPFVTETIDETLGKRNWDFYRRNYRRGKYTFTQLKELNDIWTQYIMNSSLPQYRYDPILMEQAFSMIPDLKKKVILELGCGHGYLAGEMLNKFEIKKWTGLDISKVAVENSVCTNEEYHPLDLKGQFWETKYSDEYDVFVSTHALEHFIWPEIPLILEEIDANWLILEVPLNDRDKVWRKGASSHVLDKGWLWLKTIIKDHGFNIIYDQRSRTKKMNVVGMWEKA